MSKHTDNQPERIIPLAPSGVSPWGHHAGLHDGCLALYWALGDESNVRVFTREETATLLDLLYNSRDEILSHKAEGKQP